MKTIRERGFALVEFIVVLVIVIALAGTGYWVYKQRGDDDKKTTNTSQQDTQDGSSDAGDVPEVNDTSDLQAAEQALDDTTIDDSDAELDAQLNEF
jgi:hypothetical protein